MDTKKSHKITERDINHLQNIVSRSTFETVFDVNPFMLQEYSSRIKRDENGNIPNSIILPRTRSTVSKKSAETFRKEYEESMDRLLKINDHDESTYSDESKLLNIDDRHDDNDAQISLSIESRDSPQ